MIAEPALTRTRDIVVIGCSAGGVEALPRILQQLSSDLEAAIFITQHLAPLSPPYLVTILARNSKLPIAWAEQGARIERGRVLVAPTDVHLLLADDHVQLARTARENHSRPSIDKLFRSAAAAYGNRTIGVLLTGMLDDGVAGLRAIREAGGMVIVQDPATAQFPELPNRALSALTPDRVLPIDAIGRALIAAIREPVGIAIAPADIKREAEIDRVGSVSPDPLHALATGAVEVESALWSAVRALSDRATTLETLASDSRRIGHDRSAESYAVRAKETRRHADLARRFMLDLGRAR